jgi:hypothetical protein
MVIAEAIRPEFWSDRPFLLVLFGIIMLGNIIFEMGNQHNENSNTNSGSSDS